MKIIRKILIIFFLFPIYSFARENIVKLKERGIDRMNFYIPTEFQNRYSSFVEAEQRKEKKIYQWTIADGYLALNNYWDFQYKIEKEYHKERKNEKRSYYIWDNDVSFLKYHTNRRTEKDWTHKSLFGLKHYDEKSSNKLKNQYYKLYAGQKISKFFLFGKGGSYLEMEILANRVFAKKKDGYSFLLAGRSNQNLGYGVQWSNILESEYMNYNQYHKASKNKWESNLRWTYELNKNIAFSPEIFFKIEKYHGALENYQKEFSITPYLLFTKEIKKNFRVYGKVGLTIFRSDKNKMQDFYSSKRQNGVLYAKVGLEYVF